MTERRRELAPCGVFCGACPSFNKTCLGCSSESREQKRKSKWGCRIRKCCYEEMKLDYCGFCEDFPCEKVDKKLLDTHKGDDRFRYRHEIPREMEKMRKIGVDEFIRMKARECTCPKCGGIVYFYHYKCSGCGKEIIP